MKENMVSINSGNHHQINAKKNFLIVALLQFFPEFVTAVMQAKREICYLRTAGIRDK